MFARVSGADTKVLLVSPRISVVLTVSRGPCFFGAGLADLFFRNIKVDFHLTDLTV